MAQSTNPHNPHPHPRSRPIPPQRTIRRNPTTQHRRRHITRYLVRDLEHKARRAAPVIRIPAVRVSDIFAVAAVVGADVAAGGLAVLLEGVRAFVAVGAQAGAGLRADADAVVEFKGGGGAGADDVADDLVPDDGGVAGGCPLCEEMGLAILV